MQQASLQQPASNDLGYRILDTLKCTLLCLDAERRITYINATGEALFENSAASPRSQTSWPWSRPGLPSTRR
jgi:nitrogen-specific signal transduction histidine kinase